MGDNPETGIVTGKPSLRVGIPEVTGTTMANILSETPSVLDGTLGRHVPEANAIPTAAVSFSGSIVDDSELERGAEEGVKDANLASLATPIKPKGSDDLVGTGATACAVASAAEREENTRDAIAISTAAPIQTSDLGGDMGDDIEHDDSYGSPVHTSSGSPLISSPPSATAKAPSKSPSLGSTNEIFSGRLGPGTPKDSLSGSGPASWASTAAPTSPESGISVADQPAKRIAAGIAVGKSGKVRFFAAVNILFRRSETIKATWYNPGLGSCSKTDSDSDLVVALASASMSGGKNCNRVRTPDTPVRITS